MLEGASNSQRGGVTRNGFICLISIAIALLKDNDPSSRHSDGALAKAGRRMTRTAPLEASSVRIAIPYSLHKYHTVRAHPRQCTRVSTHASFPKQFCSYYPSQHNTCALTAARTDLKTLRNRPGPCIPRKSSATPPYSPTVKLCTTYRPVTPVFSVSHLNRNQKLNHRLSLA